MREKPRFFEVKVPMNAPNVVIVLIDDIGVGREEARFTGSIKKIVLGVKDVKWSLNHSRATALQFRT